MSYLLRPTKDGPEVNASEGGLKPTTQPTADLPDAIHSFLMTPTGQVILHSTAGYALVAEISFHGQRLWVMDDFSDVDCPATPGPLEDVEFTADDFGSLDWDETFRGNPNREKKLVHLADFRYLGYGRIVQIRPTVVDFGLFSFEIGHPTNDPRCIDEFILINIDRLTLRRVNPSDPLHG